MIDWMRLINLVHIASIGANLSRIFLNTLPYLIINFEP